jgi:hypothetical protein
MGTFDVWNKVVPYNVIYENYVNYINDITNFCPLLTLTVPSNETNITIPESSVASSYPITFNVSNVIRPIGEISLSLSGYSVDSSLYYGIVLVSPNGSNYSLIIGRSDSGSATNTDVLISNTGITAWDGVSPGDYYNDAIARDDCYFNSPCPVSLGSGGSTNSIDVFLSNSIGDINGIWSLYIQNFGSSVTGSLSGATLTIKQQV